MSTNNIDKSIQDNLKGMREDINHMRKTEKILEDIQRQVKECLGHCDHMIRILNDYLDNSKKTDK